MTDYYSNRSDERFTFREVDLRTWAEGMELGNITGGSADVSANSDLKGTCSFDYYGTEEIDANKGVRIYHSFTDDFGDGAEDCIGTYIVGFDDCKKTANYEFDGEQMACTGARVSGTVTGWSVLKIAQDNGPALAYTLEAGANVIDAVRGILEGLGLRVVPEKSAYALKPRSRSRGRITTGSPSATSCAGWLDTTLRSPTPGAWCSSSRNRPMIRPWRRSETMGAASCSQR